MPVPVAPRALALAALLWPALLWPALARAQDAPPPYAPPPPGYGSPPETTVAPPPPEGPNPGLDSDPHIDRVWFSPTAITQPAGSFEFNDWELILLGLTYGVTDNFQLSAVILPPLVEDMPFVGALSGKLSLPIGERVHFGVGATIGYESEDDTAVGLLGAVVSICTDGPCASLFSVFVYTGFSLSDDDDAVPFAYGVSLMQRVATHVKLLLEVASGGLIASTDADFAEGALVSYGVRFFGDNIAGDVGFVRPISFGRDYDDPFILGIPAVTISYRW
jgi:hypothetical protein